MKIQVSAQSAADLAEYARIPIRYEVREILEVKGDGKGGALLLPCDGPETSYIKDYDACKGEGPLQWKRYFNLAHWGLFAAHRGGQRVGGAAVVFRSAELLKPEGRDDLAVLWDIRVAPEARGQGVGSALFEAVESWAVDKGCVELKVETQNINVAACRFYQARGCEIERFKPFAYPDFPGEVQIIWRKDISGKV